MALPNAAANLIAGFEGFRENPYWDVNAYRSGFGSDTMTLPDGRVVPISQGQTVTREDAERDLTRRVGEFQATAAAQVGQGTWNSMSESQQAALTSIAYNYGSLPDRITSVIASGGDVGAAINALGSDNDGINASRRSQEASLFSGGDYQVAQASTGTQDDAVQDWSGVHNAFLGGQMTDAQQQAYRDGLSSGDIPAAPIPPSILEAYQSGQMTPEQLDKLDAAVGAGLWALPDVAEVPRGVGEEILRQGGLTARAGIEGLASIPALVIDPVVGAVNWALPDDWRQMTLTEFAKFVSDGIGLPSPEDGPERVAQAAAQAIAAGGGSVALARKVAGFLSGGVSSGAAGALAEAPLSQLIGGGTAGAAAQTTAELGGGPVPQVLAGLAGGAVGAGLTPRRLDVPNAPTTPINPRNTSADDALVAADRAGIRVLTSDILPPKTFASRWLQTAGERVPGAGTGPVRSAQRAEQQAAINNTLRDFGADYAPDLSEDVMRDIVGDLTGRRAAALTQYSTMKNEVFANVAGAGDVPVTRTLAAIDEQISRLTSLNDSEVRPVIRELINKRNAIQNQGIENLDEIRGMLGKAFDAQQFSANARSQGNRSMRALYGPIMEDIGDFIQANGQRRDYTRWRVSNARISDIMGELDNNALKAVLTRGDATPETVERLLFNRNRSDVAALYRNLSPDGRGNARAAILNRAMRKAAESSGGVESISPQKFMRDINRLGHQTGVFFNDAQLDQVRGLATALELTQRASSAAANPATGQQLALPVGAAILTDMLGGAARAIGGGAALGLSARFYESPPVRNMLMELSRAEPGAAQAAIMRRLISTAQDYQRNEQERDNGRQ